MFSPVSIVMSNALILAAAIIQASPVWALATRQPTPDPLLMLNLSASAIAPSPGSLSQLPAPGDKCAAALSGNAVLFPNARIVRSAAGYIECRQRLAFGSVPAGYAFTVVAVEVGGMLDLEKGSVLEQVKVGVGYLVSPDLGSVIIKGCWPLRLIPPCCIF